MRTRAHRTRQRVASLAVRVESAIIEEAQKVANAAGLPLQTYVGRAIQHYNQYHRYRARAKSRQLQPKGDARVLVLFPPNPQPAPSPPRRRRRSKRRPR